MINVVWLKRDLRLFDNAPLVSANRCALEGRHKLLIVYIIEDEYWKLEEHSYRQWEFIKQSLLEMRGSLRDVSKQNIVVLRGDTIQCFADLHQHFGINAVYSHEETGIDWTFQRDIKVAKFLTKIGVPWHQHSNGGVIRKLKSRNDWKQLQERRLIQNCVPEPSNYASPPDHNLPDTVLTDFTLDTTFAQQVQQGGRRAGTAVLESFLSDRARKYQKSISKPGLARDNCSRLSPHLSFGTLSIREVMQATWSAMRNAKQENDWILRKNLAAFQSRLHWHCHFIQKLEDQPEIEFRCMHSAFEGMREPHHREDRLEGWRNGQTGYPFVDACMRSLIQTGYLNFRMRAMLVSFAAYHLFLDWRKLNPILAALFTDYEPGIHISQLQMQSGVTGINALRIYNPVKQGLDHDPRGDFIREFVPEVRHLTDEEIHLPSNIYTQPIVELSPSLKFAREAISKVRKSDNFRTIAQGVYNKLGSRKQRSFRQSNQQPVLLTREQITSFKTKK